MNRFDECINLSNEIDPCFVCTWNDGEIVEIHTKNTLLSKYSETNLFDGELPFYDPNGEELAIGLIEWIDGISKKEFWFNAIYDFITCDNFKIQRIK